MDVRWQSSRPPKVECTWHGPSDLDVEAGASFPSSKLEKGGRLLWVDQARHFLLLMRLQRPYFLYCMVCAVLSTAAFLSTLVDLLSERRVGRRWEDILQGGTWQSAAWTTVAMALCAEVACTVIVKRGNLRHFMEDWWSAFDATLVLLTFLAWAVMGVRRASPMREEAEEADLWLLALRFFLQPCRAFAAAKMARRVQIMQQSHMDVNFDALSDAVVGPAQACGHFDGGYSRSHFPSSSSPSAASSHYEEAAATPMPSIFVDER